MTTIVPIGVILVFKQILAFLSIVLIGLLFINFPVQAEVHQATCGAGQIRINEVNYATAGEAEFIEIQADSNVSLNRFEIRLIDSSGSHYLRHSLDGETTSDLGYFVAKGEGGIDIVSSFDMEHVMDVGIVDWITDATPGGIGIYDVDSGDYCNFVNYGGTVSQFGDYLQIGRDSTADGQNRSCTYAFGSWRCNRPSTPASANSTLVIQINHVAMTSHPTVLLTLTSVLTLTLTSFVIKRK